MRHYFALSATGPIPGLAGRMPKPAGAALLIAPAGALEGAPTRVSGAGPRAVPLPAVTHPAQEEQLPTVRPAADDQPQRIHALPRSGRGGWTTTRRYAKKGAANRALPGVVPPEGPEWSDSGPSPLSAVGGYGLPQLTPPRNGPVPRPVANSALLRDRPHRKACTATAAPETASITARAPHLARDRGRGVRLHPARRRPRPRPLLTARTGRSSCRPTLGR